MAGDREQALTGLDGQAGAPGRRCRAVGFVAVGDAAKARAALTGARARDTSRRRMGLEGKDWLAAFIELMDGRTENARREMARYAAEVPARVGLEAIQATSPPTAQPEQSDHRRPMRPPSNR